MLLFLGTPLQSCSMLTPLDLLQLHMHPRPSYMEGLQQNLSLLYIATAPRLFHSLHRGAIETLVILQLPLSLCGSVRSLLFSYL